MNVLGYEIDQEYKEGQFILTSKRLPELLVVSDDVDEAIADVDVSITAILKAKSDYIEMQRRVTRMYSRPC